MPFRLVVVFEIEMQLAVRGVSSGLAVSSRDDFTAQLPALAKPPKEQRLKLMRYQFDMVGNMKNACAAEEAVHRSRRTSEEIGAILCNNR
ncbi:hypothetical protein F2P81_002220 [Scophthalmus maximus]|uniref:Uncharacterized protein n=1 Tax=Scophthalmus maximus TaxID=52904 RepID=A0A6A4TSK4_SCOMX|nr:hypothetical protein F2P81_002220 [Scophthalmus maximus]